jgi:predicted secreted Zn-dependent protease
LSRSAHRGATPTPFAVGLLALLVAACAGLPAAATPESQVTTGPPTPSPAPSAAADRTPRPSATASPSSAAELLPIAGVWRVRKTLSAEDRSGLITDPAFDEETYSVKAGCPDEPCDSLEVTTTPLGLTSPATVIQLARKGATYASTTQPAVAASCLSSDGSRVDGGASATSTLELWMATDRPAGPSVASTVLRGVVELDVLPTPIGESAGCQPLTASFDLTGRREEVAVRDPNGGAVGPDIKPPTGAALVRLPSLNVTVKGAKIDYFGVTGDTSRELAASIARGGVKACGAIDYEWFRGDARPAACVVTRVSDTRQSIRTRTSAAGACRITSATITASYTIHMPRWTEPTRVPKRLLDWWRKIVDFIADHEAGHVRIGGDYIKKLNARLVGKPCEDISAIIRSWVTQHAEAQEAYDRGEYSRAWPTPAAGF